MKRNKDFCRDMKKWSHREPKRKDYPSEYDWELAINKWEKEEPDAIDYMDGTWSDKDTERWGNLQIELHNRWLENEPEQKCYDSNESYLKARREWEAAMV